MSLDQKMLERLISINKLIYMQTRPKIEELKTELLKTDQQKKAYEALDGTRNIDEIAKFAGYSIGPVRIESMLPLGKQRIYP